MLARIISVFPIPKKGLKKNELNRRNFPLGTGTLGQMVVETNSGFVRLKTLAKEWLVSIPKTNFNYKNNALNSVKPN